jgi:hypothetical protein
MRQKLTQILVAALLVTTLAASPAAATSHDDETTALFDSNGELSIDTGAMAFVTGEIDRYAFFTGMYDRLTTGAADAIGLGDQPEANETASQLQGRVNATGDDWVAYANDRDWGSDNLETLALTIQQDGTEETIYLVADYNASASAYESFHAVDEYDGEPDHTATLSGRAADSAVEEFNRAHSEFIKPNEDFTASYASEMAGKYGETPHVTSTLLGGTE